MTTTGEETRPDLGEFDASVLAGADAVVDTLTEHPRLRLAAKALLRTGFWRSAYDAVSAAIQLIEREREALPEGITRLEAEGRRLDAQLETLDGLALAADQEVRARALDAAARIVASDVGHALLGEVDDIDDEDDSGAAVRRAAARLWLDLAAAGAGFVTGGEGGGA